MARYLLLTCSFLFCSLLLVGQTSLGGAVSDDNGEPVILGSVAVYKNGNLVTGTETDFDGNYSITSLDPGNYDVEFSAIGYPTLKVEEVVVFAGKSNKLDAVLSVGIDLDVIEVTGYVVPLIEQDNTTQGQTLTSDQIKNLPSRDVNALAALAGGVATADEGEELNIRGSRGNATNYYLDGIRISGRSINQQDIDQLQVITGGVPAQYGDVTGGIISITSKGPSSQFSGGFEVETSQIFDNYNYNLLTANLSGPIIKNKNGESILGFRVSGQYLKQDDDDPPATDIYKINDEVLAELQANPIRLLPQAGGTFSPVPEASFINTDSYVTQDGREFLNPIEVLDYNPNEGRENIDLIGKLDLRVNKAIDLTFTGTYNSQDNQFTPGTLEGGTTRNSRENQLEFQNTALRGRGWQTFNSHNNPTQIDRRYRGNVRFRHRIGASNAYGEDAGDGGAEKTSLIQNASYTIQFGYQLAETEVGDARHDDRFFDYGYLGQFNRGWIPTFGIDTSGSVTHLDYTPIVVNDPNNDPTLPENLPVIQGANLGQASYVPGGVNPTLEQYLLADFPEDGNYNFDALNVFNGFVGADYSSVNALHSNVGTVMNRYNKTKNERYTLDINGSFELVPSSGGRHNVQFGILYEQWINRSYTIQPFSLWGLGRQLANAHLEGQGLDTTIVLGETTVLNQLTGLDELVQIYGSNTTNPEDATFYKSARAINGVELYEYLNVDGLDPNQMRLDMFSARDLNDNSYLSYYGYDYLGNELNGLTFDDFFTEEDADGVRTFPIGAFEPNYTAAFIQDKFTFKDIIFRLGVRVDRYDANTKVLKDPYSLYDITNANDFHNNFGGERPGNIGDDFKVYTSTNNGTGVRAYRDGDTWFFADGTQANSGDEVFGSEPVFPKLVDPEADIKQKGFNTDASFEDYAPQINVMPRLAFSFPISDEANFFAHYDILVQRPPSNNIVTPTRYFYWEQTGLRNNANLRPEKTIDYEIGFQQKLSNSSALKMTAYYKELRDMVQSRFFFQVADIGLYETYDNVDFATIKGFSASYDLRRTNNVQLNLSYTLQFADGTGSDANSSRGSATREIQRALFPMSYDERNIINFVMDYRYGSGKRYNGPVLFGQDIFASAGVNLNVRAVSGRPYTRQEELLSELRGGGVLGSINGSRLPWNYTLNLRVDKSFTIAKPGSKYPLNFNVWFRVSNLLDRQNIASVYRVTGDPSDDGWLVSSRGQDFIEGDNFLPDGYLSSYQWRVTNPDNFTLPRRMYIGLAFDF